MGEASKVKVKDKSKDKSKEKVKKHRLKNLKAEFKKIVWPDKKSAAKITVAVIIFTIVLGAIIKVIDMLIQTGISFIA